jgi:hypothetical protein
MFSKEGEPGLLMVEFLDVFPTRFSMTLLARFAQSSFMLIILPMTAQTLGGDFPFLLGMTLSASHQEVLSYEGVQCGGVIEADLLPALG